jgi:hypothetical protein
MPRCTLRVSSLAQSVSCARAWKRFIRSTGESSVCKFCLVPLY